MIETGVVNGRFQVLHLKHMEYILAAKMRAYESGRENDRRFGK